MPDNTQELGILIKAQQQTTAAFEGARNELKQLGQQSQQTNNLLGGLKTGLGALGVAFSATAVIGFAKDVLDTAGNINDLAHAIGISTDAVQDFTLAAEQSGATIDDVGIAINKLNVEAGNNSTGFEKLGLSLEKIQALSPEERFRAVADALQQIEDPAVRAALGQELLGKGYRNLASAIDEGIGKTRDANKMSKETIETLDGLGDAIVRAGTKTKNFFGEALAKAVNIPRDLIRDMKADLDRLGISIDTIVAKAPGIPAAFRGQGPIRLAPLNTEEIAQIEDGLNKERKALDETAKAADQHAQKIKELNDAIFGRTAIAAANDYVQALGPINNLSKVSAENQKKMNATVLEAIEAYDRLGKTAPAALNQIYVLTASLPEATRGITNVIKDLGYEAEVALPKLYDLPKPVAITSEELELLGRKSSLTLKDLIPAGAQTSKVNLDALSASLAQLAQVSDGSFGKVSQGLSSVVAGMNTAVSATKSLNDGIAAFADGAATAGFAGTAGALAAIAAAGVAAGKALQPLLGLHHGKLGALLGTNKDGRALIEDFAASFGGFDGLQKKLQETFDPATANRYWVALTQGVGRSNPTEAKSAIDLVTAALDAQKKKQDEAGTAAAAAADAQIAAQQKVTDKIKASISGIDDQIKTLSDSIAGEAPEEFMGVVERQTRDRIAQLATQRQELENQLQEQQADTNTAVQDVGDSVDGVTTSAQTALGIFQSWKDAIEEAGVSLSGLSFPMPPTGTSPVPGFAGGTRGAYLDFGAGTPVVLHGRERVMTEREGDQSSGGYLGTTVINIDGHEIARASTRYQRQVLAPYGVR